MHVLRPIIHQAQGAQLVGIEVIGFGVYTGQVDERFVVYGLLHCSPHCCRQGAQLLVGGHPLLPLFSSCIYVPEE